MVVMGVMFRKGLSDGWGSRLSVGLGLGLGLGIGSRIRESNVFSVVSRIGFSIGFFVKGQAF
jgi:hypothetical protein